MITFPNGIFVYFTNVKLLHQGILVWRMISEYFIFFPFPFYSLCLASFNFMVFASSCLLKVSIWKFELLIFTHFSSDSS